MKDYIVKDEWCIIEKGFHPEYNEITESLMSLGNGRMGQRGSFEENYSGKSLQGNYIAGVWFPDKTRVGWWKNGYPHYFAKVINATNWNGIDIKIKGERVDLAKCEIIDFERKLNMREGVLYRTSTIKTESGLKLNLNTIRFCSMADDESAQISYSITPLNFSEEVVITTFLDGDVKNRDANHDEKFWEEINKEILPAEAYLTLKTKKSPWDSVPTFTICTGQRIRLFQNGKELLNLTSLPIKKEKYVGNEFKIQAFEGEEIVIQKFVVNLSSLNYEVPTLLEKTKDYLNRIFHLGFTVSLSEHKKVWEDKWNKNDIEIKGDIAAQQGIRFNIFQIQQTYTGEDSRLNIGPKGFTGEKYGGVTYWDTEAYCIPFYLSTADQFVARNLLIYRYNQLGKAIDNAKLLGFKDGAALYPMVTMNGEECHNEWEITFEEIHRNGAIAYAIYDYITYTGDQNYLAEYGLEVLIAISRFWAQRVNWSDAKQKYVMLGVTGPNEYENNVNNNWYTNYIAVWTLKYTIESINFVKSKIDRFGEIVQKIGFDETIELQKWEDIIAKMHFPFDEGRQVFLQQDNFLDKEILSTDAIENQRPINQKWSWDRILRSCFIKQADVLQGMYFFEDDFSLEELERNFDFYEPMTVHESSLSPCVHSILANRLGKLDMAYDMYLRTSRLDLDDYNNDTEDGLHITSMAGTWMSIVKGFGGMRVKDEKLYFDPQIPGEWDSYSFRIGFRNNLIKVVVDKQKITVENLNERELTLKIAKEEIILEGNKTKELGNDRRAN